MASSISNGSRARFSASSSRSAPRVAAVPSSVRSLAYSSRVQMTSWDSSCSTTGSLREATAAPVRSTAPKREVVRLGNKGAGGPFAPLVVVVRNIVGEKEFNKLRGKAISVHSQVIKDFCKQVGVDNKQVQAVVRLAKKNGEWLGFLA
ncbi:Protein PROTON GRADIENT REGULATION 5 Flags: Precursor [Monoraphidium neglectum]|uniref:Protein PROTON GRADIENT REGULATION 5, chloroplastic n=1 Tax=Monoraphidium neglectum TaxID=145388 RepID=A0A0D2M7T7_9CHLO|nr:Protein PROTON GRADIENT REGULATION 5 Flags: Precursor [Monoraphidium neglectum]KIY97161.1 Protein PROTON GRADIENT REGULATION 5 Flags: Precursor [Monoraphidium neglectum]|eukprot:XP_013896181.1 Protein PROTON GRADIENT REGULATION 5 Flags: Precursor [Monoraphidium neglectum]